MVSCNQRGGTAPHWNNKRVPGYVSFGDGNVTDLVDSDDAPDGFDVHFVIGTVDRANAEENDL